LDLGFLALAAFRFWGFGFLRFLVFDFGFFARAEHGPDFWFFFLPVRSTGPKFFLGISRTGVGPIFSIINN
jgi:hypothetical protein